MKYDLLLNIAIFTLCGLIAFGQAAPAAEGDEVHAETLRFESENNGVDKYAFAYDTSNGITRSEHGELKQGEEGAAIISSGNFQWAATDGKKYEITFTADETGYHPVLKFGV